MQPPSEKKRPLTDRTVSASAWQFFSVAAQMVLQLAVLAALSRLLDPEAFGVVGVAMICVQLAKLFTDLGITAALIQRPSLTDGHLRAAFTLSLVAGVVFAVAVWFLSPSWAWLFATPAVEPVLRLLSVSFLASSLGFVSHALLWRGMRFKAIALAEVVSYAAGYGVVGMSLAASGHGVWSLAWAVVVQTVTRTALFFFRARHPLALGWRRQEAGEILGYGFGMTLTRLFNFLATRGDYLVVGRWLGAGALGLYERAYRLTDLLARNFAGVIDKVLFPAMSEIQEEREKLARVYLSAMGLVALVYLPVAASLVLLAPRLVEVLFGEQWLAVVAPFRVLSLSLLFRSSYRISDSLIRAKGAVYQSAWRVLLYAVAVLAGSWLGKEWGITGVAWGVAAAILLKYVMISNLCLNLVDLGWSDLLRRYFSGVTVAAGTLAALLAGQALLVQLDLPQAVTLGGLLLTAVAASAGMFFVLPASWLGADFFRLIRGVEARIPVGKRILGFVAARGARAESAESASEATRRDRREPWG